MRNEQILRLEEMDADHWWTRSRLNLVKSFVLRYCDESGKVFEVGAGSGGTLIELKSLGFQVQALEPTKFGADRIRKNGIEVMENTIDHLKSMNVDADILLLLDVLEHLEDDGKGLETLHKATSSKTLLCITVPADPSLWSKLDDDVYHFRRYTKDSISKLLTSNNWEMVEIRYWMSILKPVVRFRRKVLKGSFMSETKLPNRLINYLLKLLLRVESKNLTSRIPGTTIVVVAKKLNA